MTPAKILYYSIFLTALSGSFALGPFISIYDPTEAKEFIIILSIIAIAILSCMRKGEGKKPVLNLPLYALLIYLPVSIHCVPPIELMYGHEDMGGMWIWQSMFWVMLYWVLYECLIRIELSRNTRMKIVKAIGWAAIISSIYALFQVALIDEFQFVKSIEIIGDPAAKHITGMIGNPTYLAVWLVMCFPFIIAYFKWPSWILIGSVVLMCQSDIGTAGLVITVIGYAALRARSTIWLKLMVGSVIIAIAILALNWQQIRPKITDNGRFTVWEQTFQDWKNPVVLLDVTDEMSSAQKSEAENLNKRTYSLTGRGPGSFKFIFGPKYSSQYESAHNEYLEILYSIGIIGLILFLATICFTLYNAFSIARVDPFFAVVFCSFTFSCVAAVGIPLWHEEPLRYLSAMTFSMLAFLKSKI